MAVETILVGISTGAFALAGGALTAVWTRNAQRREHELQREAQRLEHGVQREERVHSTSRALAEEQQAAYINYLVAQHVVAVLIKDVEPIERGSLNEALGQHYASRRRGSDRDAWHQSGATEMRARLLAEKDVLAAIDAFEQFVHEVLVAALMHGRDGYDREPAQEWDKEWTAAQNRLIDTMREEQHATFAQRLYAR